VAADLGVAPLDPRLLRRNIVLRGADLGALREQELTLEQDGEVLAFRAGGETSPCPWMDAVLAPGARDALRGRGGLRAMPLTSGRLRLGPAVLRTRADLDPARAGLPVRRRPRLP
jgi:MOSC domain-containing protein YiiM